MTTLAVDATHVLVVESPGAWRTRVALEREVVVRGWRLAASPADADAIVVAGAPGPQLSARIESTWEQLPGPRARAVVDHHADASTVTAVLDVVTAALLDTDQQTLDAHERRGATPRGGDDTDSQMAHDADSDDDMDMSGDMEMDMSPSGIPLAEGAEDRDGLRMDVLHVPLGPVLPYWPAGMVLHCTLAGDVVVTAVASVLDDSDRMTAGLSRNERAALRCDQLAGLLALAGWSDGRVDALRARDALVDGADASSSRNLLEDLERRLQRSRVLRWSLRGIGVLHPGDDTTSTPAHLQGDVYERLVKLADRARAELSGDAAPQIPLPVLLAVAERLVTGLDLAAARLVVASLAIDAFAPSAQTLDTPQDMHRA